MSGLSPTVDQDSVRIETTSSVNISDVLVESIPNRDIWQDVYPSDSESESDAQDDDDDDFMSFKWKERPELQAAKRRQKELEEVKERATERIANAESRLKFLDGYGKALGRESDVHVDIADGLDTYRQERAKLHEDIMGGRRDKSEAEDALEEHLEELNRIRRKDRKEEAKARKAWNKEHKHQRRAADRRRRQRVERAKEKRRIHHEREEFWPKFYYAVRISIAVNSFTPGSSRRTSIATDVDVSRPLPDDSETIMPPPNCDLILSYVTSSAHWTPSYDLKLSTTTNTGVLSFEAELHNSTSETWSECRVSLSTSQAALSGLQDDVPELTPWHLGLSNRMAPFSIDQAQQQILRSGKERESLKEFKDQQRPTETPRFRKEMFLREHQGEVESESSDEDMGFGLFGDEPTACARGPAVQNDLFSIEEHTDSVQAVRSSIGRVLQRGERLDSLAVRKSVDNLESTGPANRRRIDEYESDDDRVVEETGLTTTIDLPGLKYLQPKHASTKSHIARVTFSRVMYSHTIVAKYKPVAFLQARMRNTSRMTLFKGRVGLTLDGCFLGKTSLPRCSTGAELTLSLGIDPAIKVTYPKPLVQRGTVGVFNKDNTWLYTRSILLHNTRGVSTSGSGLPIFLKVLDQVPISQDEKLRVEVLSPEGLSLGGGVVAAGAPGLDTKEARDWGRAAASLKRDGEVQWEVSLNSGKAVRLALKFGVAFPSGTYPYNDEREK